ncbi:hypothetical protein PU463_00029455 [Pseudomonas aeruginosa]
MLVKAGFADEAEVARARGRDPRELKKSRETEIKANRAAGLSLRLMGHYQSTSPMTREGCRRCTWASEDAIPPTRLAAYVNRYGAGLSPHGPDFPTRATMEAPMGNHQTLIHKSLMLPMAARR